MEEKTENKSALSVTDGVPHPPATNSEAIERLKKLKKKKFSCDDLVQGILAGDKMQLSRAITLIESNLAEHGEQAQEILKQCLPSAGNSVRIGITGVPGVGKSTFIEAFGRFLTSMGHKVAVLAIDPSSEKTKGSILGDKTRMESLSTDPNAFIRPSPSAGSLGGVARKTRETIFLCEAAGFDVIIIETVGVGQSETAVHSMVDFFFLLMLAGAGDELQGIKRGIMEMADLIAITKADGNNEKKARMARIEYLNALHLFPPTESGWKPDVLTCSSVSGIGIDNIWDKITEYRNFTVENKYFNTRRDAQKQYWMQETILGKLEKNFFEHPAVEPKIEGYKEKVLKRELSSFMAAQELFDIYLKALRK
ncbi:MAG TPA: methylmalonyl Co-A mutase-associated GTPase MeaB [Bacteroidales bacterium]|jgi:LAO/AO transport system kinase|nr:methylmalonyl Co-A mutase-associated GTPase MeaB [Bacteroidales bacterium]